MLLLRTGITLFCLGRKCSKLFHTPGFTELRRLIFIEQLFREGNLHSFSSLKKPLKSEMSITLAISTTKAITERNSVKKIMRPSQNNLHLIRQSRQSGCNNLKNLVFPSYHILFLEAKILHRQGEHRAKLIGTKVVLLVFYIQWNKL